MHFLHNLCLLTTFFPRIIANAFKVISQLSQAENSFPGLQRPCRLRRSKSLQLYPTNQPADGFLVCFFIFCWKCSGGGDFFAFNKCFLLCADDKDWPAQFRIFFEYLDNFYIIVRGAADFQVSQSQFILAYPFAVFGFSCYTLTLST